MNKVSIIRQLDSYSSLELSLDKDSRDRLCMYITYRLEDGDMGSRLDTIKVLNINTDDLIKIKTAIDYLMREME